MYTYITPRPLALYLCLLSTATILSSSSSSSSSSAAAEGPATTLSTISRATVTSTAKRQRTTAYAPSSLHEAAVMTSETLLSASAHSESQPGFGLDATITTCRDALLALRIASAKVIMQPQGLQIQDRMSGQRYLDAFTQLPLTDSMRTTHEQHQICAHWQTLIQTIATCPDQALACKYADDFIALLAQNRINSSFDFAARTLLAKAHRLAHEGLHALEQKDGAQAKEHLHHATILYYRLRPMNLTVKVHDFCIIPDVTADFKRLEACLQCLGTLKVELPNVWERSA